MSGVGVNLFVVSPLFELGLGLTMDLGFIPFAVFGLADIEWQFFEKKQWSFRRPWNEALNVLGCRDVPGAADPCPQKLLIPA